MATYARVVVDKRLEKEEVIRTQIIVGGGQLDFQGDTSIEIVGLETAKMVFNSVMSTPEAKFMTIDINNMYTNRVNSHMDYTNTRQKILHSHL